MQPLSITIFAFSQSLAWALFYSLWQGMLLYGIVYAVVRAMPSMNARIKYLLSYGALTGTIVWFADTWTSQYQKIKGVTVYITEMGINNAPDNTHAVNAVPANAASTDFLTNLLPQIERYFPALLTIYAIGIAFMIIRLAVNVAQLWTVSKKGMMPATTFQTETMERWQERLQISAKVKIYLSAQIDVPMMMGAIKPVILLPIAAINNLSTDEVEAIIIHELAHIKRHDYLLNVIQTLIETILFFNPFIWLLSAIVRREREHCCDDIVVASASSPLPYAKALALLEQTRINNSALSMAATGNKNQLLTRIKRIMEMKKSNVNYSQLALLTAGISLVVVLVSMISFTPSFAHDTDDTLKKKSTYVVRKKTITVDNNGKRTEKEEVTNGTPQDEESTTSDINISIKKDKNKPNGNMVLSVTADGGDGKKTTKSITINTDDIMKEVATAMATVKNELSAVDWGAIGAEIEKGLRDAQKGLTDAEAKIDLTEMTKEIAEKVKKDMHEAKKEMEQAKAEAERNKTIVKERRIIASAGDDEDGAQPEDFGAMLKSMEADGLIDRSRKYSVEKENGILYINGEKQSDKILKKYKNYLKANNIVIKGSKGSLNVRVGV